MQTARIVQAVVLMMIVAVAASCAASKQYTSKLFAPRTPVVKDSQPAVASLRFLELDKVEGDQSDWVSTDIIMGRDTANQTLALDKFAETFPAAPVANNNNVKTEQPATTAVAEKNPAAEKSVVSKKNAKVKNVKKGEQPKVVPVPSETIPEEAETVPVARNLNTGEVRAKRTRDE
jgi:hypothetical protein